MADPGGGQDAFVVRAVRWRDAGLQPGARTPIVRVTRNAWTVEGEALRDAIASELGSDYVVTFDT